jgi:hypothetical protein
LFSNHVTQTEKFLDRASSCFTTILLFRQILQNPNMCNRYALKQICTAFIIICVGIVMVAVGESQVTSLNCLFQDCTAWWYCAGIGYVVMAGGVVGFIVALLVAMCCPQKNSNSASVTVVSSTTGSTVQQTRFVPVPTAMPMYAINQGMPPMMNTMAPQHQQQQQQHSIQPSVPAVQYVALAPTSAPAPRNTNNTTVVYV